MGYGNIVAYRIVDRRVTGQAIETVVRVPYGDTRAISLGYYVTRCIYYTKAIGPIWMRLRLRDASKETQIYSRQPPHLI
mgnify:CR=1 FL=1